MSPSSEREAAYFSNGLGALQFLGSLHETLKYEAFCSPICSFREAPPGVGRIAHEPTDQGNWP